MFVYIFSCFLLLLLLNWSQRLESMDGWLVWHLMLGLDPYLTISCCCLYNLPVLPIYYTINRFQFLMIFLFVIFFSSLVDLAKTLLTKLIHNNDIFRLFLVVHFFLLASPKTISGFLFGIYSQLCVNKYYL